jgi:hypothetical protein
MPADWQSLFGDTPGAARFCRWFHAPTNLDPDERVRLTWAGIGGEGTIALNGTVLQVLPMASTTATVDITAALQPRNRVEVMLRFDPTANSLPGGLFGEIALVISSDGP